MFNNPTWNKNEKVEDVSVLKMKEAFTFTDAVQPACLAHKGWELPDGFICVVSGFGMESGSGSPAGSRYLRQAALNYMNDPDCFVLYQNAGLDTTDDMQCFGTR